jgi:hypothetical protein
MATPPRGAVVAGVISVALVAAVLLGEPPNDGAPLDPRSDGPLGTSALVSLVEELGGRADLSVGLPRAGDDVALLLSDRLDEDQTADVLRWVRDGGTLVVMDPGSSLAPAGVIPGDPLDTADLERGYCTLDALEGVEVVDGGAAARYDADGAYGSCLGSRDFAFVVATEEGAGDIVAIGGASFATNDQLAKDDNAVLAAGLLVPEPGTTVRFVDPPLPAGGGDRSLYDLVSAGVRRGGIQLGLAFLVYAMWRAVRLGRPVREHQAVEIAGAELVGAAGRLLERGRSPGAAAEVLREGLRRPVRARLGVSAHAPSGALAQVVADRAGIELAQAQAAVGEDPVTTEDELVAVARAIASVHQEVLR